MVLNECDTSRSSVFRNRCACHIHLRSRSLTSGESVATRYYCTIQSSGVVDPGCAVRVRTFTTDASSSLFMLYAPERQVDARQGDARFLGDLMPEVLLRVAGHDQQAAMRQPLRKCDEVVFSPEQKQAIRAEADGGDYGAPFPVFVRAGGRAPPLLRVCLV